MSMIDLNKTEKSRHLKLLLPQLWQCKTTTVTIIKVFKIVFKYQKSG